MDESTFACGKTRGPLNTYASPQILFILGGGGFRGGRGGEEMNVRSSRSGANMNLEPTLQPARPHESISVEGCRDIQRRTMNPLQSSSHLPLRVQTIKGSGGIALACTSSTILVGPFPKVLSCTSTEKVFANAQEALAHSTLMNSDGQIGPQSGLNINAGPQG